MQTKQRSIGGYRLIFGSIGYIIAMMGAVIMLPLAILPFYPEDLPYAKCFLIPGLASLVIGYLVTFILKKKKTEQLRHNRDAVMCVLAWIVAIFIGAVPFILTGKYTFTCAVFEATSGFSTTGFTVTDLTDCPHIVIMYRSMLHLVGGVGLILIMSAVFSEVYGMKLYNAEGHMERLEPNLLHSARTILAIYSGFIAGGTLLYVIFGMPLFDAINYSISAVATGGFSTTNEGLTLYDSTPIYLITIALMILGGTNFMINLFLVRGKFSKVLKHCEVKFTIAIIAVFVPIFTFLLLKGFTDSLPAAVLHALFQVVTTFTTTGFCTTGDYVPNCAAAIMPMIVLMVIGCGAGSTAGGIKEYRACITIKSIFWHIRSKTSDPKVVRSEKISKFGKDERVSNADKEEALVYVIMHLGIVAVGSWIMTLCGYGFEDSLFESTSALGTIGLSSGIANAQMHPVSLWVMIVEMLIARLEIFVIVLSLVRLSKDAFDVADTAARKVFAKAAKR